MAPVGTAAPSLATPQTDCAMVTDPLATPASRLTSSRSAFTVMELDGALPAVICSLMCTMTEPTSGTVTVTVWFGLPVTFTDWPSTCSPVTVDEPADPDSSEVHRLLITLAVSRLSPVRPMLALATSAELVTVPPLPVLPVVLVLITPTPPMPGRRDAGQVVRVGATGTRDRRLGSRADVDVHRAAEGGVDAVRAALHGGDVGEGRGGDRQRDRGHEHADGQGAAGATPDASGDVTRRRGGSCCVHGGDTSRRAGSPAASANVGRSRM